MKAVDFVKQIKGQQNLGRPDSITYYYLLVDISGSMKMLMGSLISLYQEKIKNLFQLAKKNHQVVIANLKTFDQKVTDVVSEGDESKMLSQKTLEQLKTNGGYTALRDAIVITMDEIFNLDLRANDAVLIEVLTDGLDNMSVYTSTQFMARNKRCDETGKISLVIQVPKGTKDIFVKQFHVSPDNVNEWETNVRGLVETCSVTNQSYGTYFNQRASGQTQSQTFYKNLDLQNVSDKQLQNLDNLTANFKLLKVDKEGPIREFIETKTKKPYIIGSTYYELTQDDNKVQPNKSILIMDKDSKIIYGGPNVRKILGISETQDAVLTPHNLSKYRVFAESRTVNRKLVRGTIALVDKTQTAHKNPTWGDLNKALEKS